MGLHADKVSLMTRDSSADLVTDQPTISLGPDPGTVSVEVAVPVPVEEAWAALTDVGRVACWFGAWSGALTPGANLRLDLGDGDFFDTDVVHVEPPLCLGYRWRFLGIGPCSTIEWRLYDRSPTRVVVQDSVPLRPWTESSQTGTGWADFLERFARFLHTGASTRYPWRTELDGSVELPKYDERLFDADVYRGWLPLAVSTSPPGLVLEVRGPDGPWAIPVRRVARRSPCQLQLDLGGADDRMASTCHLELLPAGGGAQLAFAHDAWPRLVAPGTDVRAARTRLTGMWIDAMRRASTVLTG